MQDKVIKLSQKTRFLGKSVVNLGNQVQGLGQGLDQQGKWPGTGMGAVQYHSGKEQAQKPKLKADVSRVHEEPSLKLLQRLPAVLSPCWA